jgi:hypothetical protein
MILLKNADLEESAEQGLMEWVSIFYETSLFRKYQPFFKPR